VSMPAGILISGRVNIIPSLPSPMRVVIIGKVLAGAMPMIGNIGLVSHDLRA
jgi:hypothetical protein